LKNDRSVRLRFGLILVAICFSTLPSLALATLQYADSYLYFPLSVVQASLNSLHLVGSGGGFNYDGYPLMILTITKITGISLESLQFCPIGGVLFSILCFALLRRILKNDILAALMTVFASFVPTLQMGMYNVFAYAWVYNLFLIFIFSFYLLMQSKNRIWIIVMVIVFLGTFSINWTTPTWIISCMFFVALLKILPSRYQSVNRLSVEVISLTLGFVIVYLAYGKAFYDVWLPKVIDFNSSQSLGLFLIRLQGFVFGNAKGDQSYRYYTYISPIQNYSTIMMYAMILSPILFCLILGLYRTIKSKLSVNLETYQSVLFWSLVFAGVIHTVAYYSVGNPSLRLILLVSPLTTIIGLEKLKVIKIRHQYIYGVALMLLSIIGFWASTSAMVESLPASYEVIKSNANWFVNNVQKGSTILSDTLTLGKNTLASESRYTDVSYDERIYSQLVNKNLDLSNVTDYAVIDVSSSKLPVNGYGWKAYEPLAPHLPMILLRPDILRVYDSGYLWVLKPRNQTMIVP
jgi:hypothetical protein